LSLLIAVCVPPVILGNALFVLLLPWMADAQYVLPGFPADEFGLDRSARADLAGTGIRSIWPVGAGTELLTAAELPDGSAAFGLPEVSHMEDVRGLVRACAIGWLVGLLGLGGSLAWLRIRTGAFGEAARSGLLWGGAATLSLVASLGLLMLIGFDAAFDGFHGIFFEGDSWKFPDDATLRRLYPDAFWGIATAWLVILAIVQAIALVLWARAAARR
jgi:integral membrane protein (TIGR01906 family)